MLGDPYHRGETACFLLIMIALKKNCSDKRLRCYLRVVREGPQEEAPETLFEVESILFIIC